MKFIAYHKKGLIITDDYTVDEIKKGVHLENLRSDLNYTRAKYFNVFDENNVFVTRLQR